MLPPDLVALALKTAFALSAVFATAPLPQIVEPVDWATLCDGETAALADPRHGKYVFLDKASPWLVARTLVLPRSAVRNAHILGDGIGVHHLILTFALPPDAVDRLAVDRQASGSGNAHDDNATRFAGIGAVRRFYGSAPGDTVRLRIDMRQNDRLLYWRSFGEIAGIDPASGMAKLQYPPVSELPFMPELDQPFARVAGGQRQMVYSCRPHVEGRCQTEFDPFDGIRIELEFSRARLRQAPALEETARALLRCFVKDA